jgi:hypothetical protein
MAGEATTTAKKNLSVDGMANIMVRHPSHDAYPSRRRGLFGISLTEATQGSGGGWGLGVVGCSLISGAATTTAKKNLSVDGMAEIMVRHPSHDAYPSRRRGLFGDFTH